MVMMFLLDKFRKSTKKSLAINITIEIPKINDIYIGESGFFKFVFKSLKE